MNKYKDSLLNTASKLDAIIDGGGQITKLAISIVDHSNNAATLELLRRMSDVLDNPKCNTEIKNIANLLNSSLIEYYGYTTIQEICKKNIDVVEDNRTLEELLEELNKLVGLENVKRKVNDLIVYQKVQKLRSEHNLLSAKNTLHIAFMGNPGTGKTTVARIVGRIYKQIGILSKGHFIEVSRTDLIAGYQGQTAIKVRKVIDRAKGGVLFIDEAYSITENDHSDSYGKECLTELTKALEDYREDLVVIVAGYTESMNKFFESNPGLKSRFNAFIEFEDYRADELTEILLNMCEKNDYKLNEDILININSYFENIINEKSDNFANGRLVRNVYEDLIMRHANRVIKSEDLSRDDLTLIILNDLYTN